MFDGKDIIVTGGAGFIGSNMVELLLERNHVTVVDNLSNVDERYISKFKGNKNFKFVRADLSSPDSMDSINGAGMVIHLAANSDVRGGSISPYPDYTNNVLATFNLLEWMRKTDTPEILFSSSSAVYGEATIMPTPENYGPYLPISTYGASKVSGEAFITAYSHYYGIRGTIFRFANIVGRNSTHGVIFDFIRKLRKDPANLEILGDGTQRKSYLHVRDCVSSMVYVHERSRKTDIYNLGNPGTTSVRKIADTVIEKMHLGDVKYNFTGGIDGRGWKGDVKVAQLGVEKLMSTGWKNTFDSDGAVAKAVQETLDQNQ
jgi:UDP-glucose 4-epimerase